MKRVDHGTKRPKWLKLIPNKKMNWSGDHLSHLIWHNQLKYYLWVDSDIIFRYQKLFLYITKLLWDDIRSYNITDECMLTSFLEIQKCFLIFLNLTKLSQEEKLAQILYPLLPNVIIIIFNGKNKIILIIMSRVCYLSFPSKPWRN